MAAIKGLGGSTVGTYSERGDARAVLAIVLNLFTLLAILFVAMFLRREPVQPPARGRNAPVTRLPERSPHRETASAGGRE
jgi:hypothetical protein